MKRMMKEDIYDDPNSWTQTTWERDQERLKVLEGRVKEYLLDIERRYQVITYETVTSRSDWTIRDKKRMI